MDISNKSILSISIITFIILITLLILYANGIIFNKCSGYNGNYTIVSSKRIDEPYTISPYVVIKGETPLLNECEALESLNSDIIMALQSNGELSSFNTKTGEVLYTSNTRGKGVSPVTLRKVENSIVLMDAYGKILKKIIDAPYDISEYKYLKVSDVYGLLIIRKNTLEYDGETPNTLVIPKLGFSSEFSD